MVDNKRKHTPTIKGNTVTERIFWSPLMMGKINNNNGNTGHGKDFWSPRPDDGQHHNTGLRVVTTITKVVTNHHKMRGHRYKNLNLI